MQSLTPARLEEMIRGGGAPRLIDVRDPWEFDICRISGAENIPMGELLGKLDSLDPNDALVVICHHGVRSQQVAAYLESMGFTKIMNLEGGVDAWSRQVDPEMPQY